jgi:signal transduction histidine kinase
VPGNRAGVGGELRVVGVRAGPRDAQVVVVAGVPTADLEASRRVLLKLMLVFFPAFLLVVAAIAWWVVGRTLRPVEQLRRGAARIGESADPGERLPVLESGDEIAALAATLNAMLERLSSASAQQRAFVADAAHELRSPLATMRTQLEVADRVGEGGSLPSELQPEVARLSALVEDLLVLARSGPEAGPATREPVDLRDVLLAAQTRHRGGRVPVRLVGADGPGDAVVLASLPELVRAIGNLVDNAVRHASTEVVLACRRDHDGWRATVSDDGAGIPAQELERVFDRFARLDEARDRDTGGSGLGLAITRELLHRNGARVWLENGHPGLRAVVLFDAPPPPH